MKTNLYVKSLEEEILLIRESEKRGGEIDAKTTYIKGLKYINNLK